MFIFQLLYIVDNKRALLNWIRSNKTIIRYIIIFFFSKTLKLKVRWFYSFNFYINFYEEKESCLRKDPLSSLFEYV
jgi:hypothetical protein